MSKYDNYYKNAYADLDYDEQLQLKLELQEGENVLWQGKPKKAARVWNSVFAPMLPFVLIWLAVDGFILVGMAASGAIGEMAFFIIPFFAIHLMPVWIWIGGIIKAIGKGKFDHYVVTDRRVLIKNENVLYNSIYFTEIVNVAVKRSLADRLAGTGDVYMVISGMGKESVLDIAEYENVYGMIQAKVLELRQAGHVPQYNVNRGVNMSYGNSVGNYSNNVQYTNNVQYGNYTNSQVDAFTEGAQYANTQYVVNGQFVNPMGGQNVNNQAGYNNNQQYGNDGYNNQNYGGYNNYNNQNY